MKKEEKTELTKKKILAAAVEEFGSKGYRGASLNAVCQSGISKGLVYHNFKNKDALYLSCVETCFEELTKYLREANIGNDLEKYLRVRMDFFERHKMEARIFFDAVLEPPEELQEQISVLKKEFDELNRELYRKILDTIHLREDVTYEEAMTYFTMMQNMFNRSFHRQSGENVALEEKVNLHERNLPKMIDIMLYGIARRNEE